MKLSIRTAFFAVVLPTAALLAALLMSPLLSYWDVKEDIDDLRLNTTEVVIGGNLSVGLHRQMKEYIEIVMGDEGAEQEASEAASDSFRALDDWKQIISREGQSDLDQNMSRLRSIEKHLLALRSISSESTALAKAGRKEKANTLLSIEAEREADGIAFEVDHMIQDARRRIDETLSRVLTLTGKMRAVPLVGRHIEDLKNRLGGIASSNAFSSCVSWQVREAIAFTFRHEKYNVEDFYEAIYGARQALAAWRRHADQERETPEGALDREQVKTAESDYRELLLALHEVLRLVQYGNTKDAEELLETKIEPLSDAKLLPLVRATLVRQEQNLHRDLDELSQSFRRISAGVIVFSLFVFALSILVPVLLYRRIVTPVLKLTDAANSLAAGSPPAPIGIDSFREINQLTAAFNQMASGLAEAEKLKAQLSQSEKMASVGQLAAGVAHEINNPLGIILGFAQSAVRRVKDDDPLSMPLKSIERESMRCKNLVQDLLTFSRATKDERVSGVDANAAIQASISLLEARCKTSHIELSLELQTALPPVKANKNQLQQIIINLCNNAVDAMPEGGKITLRTRVSKAKAGHLEIQVEDSGAGIPPEIQARIFEPFFTTKDVGSGTGLGLSLVYEIIKKHEGFIELDSEMGRGTVFTVYLPSEPMQAQAAA